MTILKKLLSCVVWAVIAPGVALATDLMSNQSPPGVNQGIVVEGTACSGVGSTGFAADGMMMSCQGGVWAKALGDVPRGSMCGLASNYYGTYSYCQGHSVNGGCPAGYVMTQFAEGNKGGIQYIRFCTKI